jgi:hypothetical protein
MTVSEVSMRQWAIHNAPQMDNDMTATGLATNPNAFPMAMQMVGIVQRAVKRLNRQKRVVLLGTTSRPVEVVRIRYSQKVPARQRS